MDILVPNFRRCCTAAQGCAQNLRIFDVFNRGTFFNRKLKFRWIGPSGFWLGMGARGTWLGWIAVGWLGRGCCFVVTLLGLVYSIRILEAPGVFLARRWLKSLPRLALKSWIDALFGLVARNDAEWSR